MKQMIKNYTTYLEVISALYLIILYMKRISQCITCDKTIKRGLEYCSTDCLIKDVMRSERY
jgi:hypothetical protein